MTLMLFADDISPDRDGEMFSFSGSWVSGELMTFSLLKEASINTVSASYLRNNYPLQ